MSVATPVFDEAWSWEGWSALNETAKGGAVDLDGNLVLAGTQGAAGVDNDDDTFFSTSSGDFGAVKLEGTSGDVLWTWTASSLDDQVDILFAVDTDSNNDVITGGSTEGYWTTSNSENVRHLAVVKLDGDTGNEIWMYQEAAQDSTTSNASGRTVYHGAGTVISLGVDGDDNVFLVGQTYNSLVFGEGYPGDSDFYAIKLDGSDGSEIWRLQGGSSFDFDSFHGAKVDSAGDLVAVGTSGDEDQMNFLAVKFSGATGSILWEYAPSSVTIDVLHSVCFDAEGNVYVAGAQDSDNLQGAMAETPVVLKLNASTSDVVWTYEGTATSRAIFQSVAIDPTTGWVVAAGSTEGTWLTGAAQGEYDFAAVVLDGDTGDELSRYQGGTAGGDSLKFVGFDSAGGFFFGGFSSALSGEQDFVAMKFGPLQGGSTTLPPSTSPTTVAPSSPLAEAPTPMAEAPAPSENFQDLPTTPSPLVVDRNTPPTTSPGPTPAPTAAVAGATVLAQWEIGAIAGAGALLLLLLALCLFCFRRKQPQEKVIIRAQADGSLPPVIAAVPKGSAVAAEVLPKRKLPSYESAVFDPSEPPPPPAPETPLAPPAARPPPVYMSPQRLQAEEDHTYGVATEETPPSYKEPGPTEAPAPVSPQAPWTRLANRVVRVPSKREHEQNYRGIPARAFGPYAPPANAD